MKIDNNILNLKKNLLNKLNLKNFRNMKNFKDLMKPTNRHEFILFILFIVYIVFNLQTPNFLIPMIDNIIGNIVVLLFAFFVFTKSNPILGILSFIVAYFVIKRSTHHSPNYAIQHYLPSEKNKSDDLEVYNSNIHQSTLEEEVIYNMAPYVKYDNEESNNDYNPVLDSSIDSSNL
jgi:hypothetical protein